MEIIKTPEGTLHNFIARVKVDPEKDHMMPGTEVTVDIALLKNLIVWMEKENPDIGGVRISLWNINVGKCLPLLQTVHQYESDRSEHYAIAPMYDFNVDEVEPSKPTRRKDTFPHITRKELNVENKLACIYVRPRQPREQPRVSWLAHVEV